MTTSSILKVIQHYQRSIEECQNDESRLLHCIGKLYKLPVNVEHLQETGIGKTVNSLRKFNGEIGVAAKALVTKWKAMVTEEEPPAVDEQQHYPQGEASGGGSSEDDHNSASEMGEKRNNGVLAPANDKSKRSDSDSKLADSEKSRSRSEKSSSKHKTSSSEASRSESRKHHSEESQHKRKREEGKEKSTHHKDKKRDRGERESGGHSKDSSQRKSSSSSEKKKEDSSGSSKHHKSSKPDKSSEERDSSSKHTSRRDNNASKSKEESDQPSSREKGHRSSKKPSTSSTTSSSGKKRRHDEENAATKEDRSHHNAAKTPKSAKEKKEEVDEPEMGIDSSMGANFADVLGMLDMPSKKSKSKTLNAVTHQTGPSTSSAAALSSRPLNGVSSSKDVSKHSHGGGGGSHSDRPSSSSTKRTPAVPDEKPDLLSDNAKLEPLDASIALALPAISTNYKPMPLNQTVMDCVFNNGSSSKPPPRSFNDAEALSHGISSKTMRTKIYSGVRTGQIHQVPSLFDLCIRVLQKNIDALEYTGGVPFEVLRPVLERATPQQLMIFEEYNPYLMEDSDVLWKAHVQRNYRVQKRQEMESWREMFNRCQEDQERKLSILAETIKQSQKIVAAPVRKTQLAFVDTMVKPPRNVQRKQEIHGTKSKLIATPAARVAALSSVTPNAAKTGDARLRVAASVRDAAQVSHGSARPKKAPLMAKTLQFMRRKR